MVILERLRAAVKAAASVVWPRNPPLWSVLSRTRYDYATTTDNGRGSSIVQSCVLWFCRAFPEAPLRVRTLGADGELTDAPAHPLARLLKRPNPYYSGTLLLWGTLADWSFGNAYLLKVRSRANLPVELWWIPAGLMEPKWPEDGSEFISHYEYTPNGMPIRVERRDVVHLRYGLDPLNPRKGLSPLGSLFRELFTDEEAANFAASLLRNMGVPGVVIAPSGDNTLTQSDAEGVKATWQAKFGGDRRGEPLVLSSAAGVTQFGFSPEQMVMRDVRRIPEERVTAIFGTPAVVVGLGAGLDRSTFANYAEAREAAYESLIIPAQRLIAEELSTQLLSDFDETGERLVLDFDLTQVRVLQADENALHERARGDLLAGLLTLNEARQMVGVDALDGPAGDALYLPSTVTPTDAAGLLTAATMPPDATGGPSGGPPPQKAIEGRKAAERVGPFEYVPDPLPPVVYDAAERKRLAKAWDDVMSGTPYQGMLEAVSVNGSAG